MDVRCESCHTEYELDDGNVSEAGTDVQCTFCGHTFVVFPSHAAPTVQPGAARTSGPTGEAEYLLETADGRTQRLRDLTILQKWIIERRVTRADRIISKNGQPWTRLGALEDLAPFFDVVDEADRARAAAGRTVSSEGLPRSPHLTPGGQTAVPRGATPGSAEAVHRSLELMAVEAPVVVHEPEITHVRRNGRGWWKLFVSFGVAAGVAYSGIRVLPSLTGHRGTAESPGLDRLGNIAREARGLLAGRVKSATTPSEPPAEPAPPPTEPAAAPPVPAEVPPPVAVEAPAPTPPPPVEAPAPAAPRVAARPRAVPPPETAPPSYDRLVAQADQLLDSGAHERALKAYERALTVRPGAPEALTGLGYVNLDRQRLASAIQFFVKASATAPYAPAMFGLGRAYRAAGDVARARDTYQRYLSLFPTGSDAAAAERQLQQLGAVETSAPERGDKEGVSAPASILQEGNAGAGTNPGSAGANEPARAPAGPDAR